MSFKNQYIQHFSVTLDLNRKCEDRLISPFLCSDQIIQESWVNTMDSDVLVPCVIRSSTAMLLIL